MGVKTVGMSSHGDVWYVRQARVWRTAIEPKAKH